MTHPAAEATKVIGWNIGAEGTRTQHEVAESFVPNKGDSESPDSPENPGPGHLCARMDPGSHPYVYIRPVGTAKAGSDG